MTALNFTLPWIRFAEDSRVINQLEQEVLPAYLSTCRWFGGKARVMKAVVIENVFTLGSAQEAAFHLLLLKVKYTTGKAEQYLLPIALAADATGINPKGVVAATREGTLIDAIYDEGFRNKIFLLFKESEKIRQRSGNLFFESGSYLDGHEGPPPASRVPDADQSNSSIIYGDDFFLKLYRKLFHDINPDVEMVTFLSEKAHFRHIPLFAGTVYWQKGYGAPVTLGMLQQKVTAVKDGWSLCGDFLNGYLIALQQGLLEVPQAALDQAKQLGCRTAELHAALATSHDDPHFSPEPFTESYTGWLLNNCQSLLKKRLRLVKDGYASLDEKGKDLSKFFIGNSISIQERFSKIKSRTFQSQRIRIHGDYHLGQLLFDGSDYVILDFEGEPEHSIKDRKIRHSPMKDVAGMLRSFHYAVSAKLYFNTALPVAPDSIENVVNHWYQQVAAAFLAAYFEIMNNQKVLDASQEELNFLLQFHLLEKAVYELGYEMNARPEWVKIPLKGIEQIMTETN